MEVGAQSGYESAIREANILYLERGNTHVRKSCASCYRCFAGSAVLAGGLFCDKLWDKVPNKQKQAVGGAWTRVTPPSADSPLATRDYVLAPNYYASRLANRGSTLVTTRDESRHSNVSVCSLVLHTCLLPPFYRASESNIEPSSIPPPPAPMTYATVNDSIQHTGVFSAQKPKERLFRRTPLHTQLSDHARHNYAVVLLMRTQVSSHFHSSPAVQEY